jgi:Fe-S oxidoreductase
VFEKHGTRGTWYAHASVGTLHVRPILDMRRDGAQKMRAIAEEACALVKEYKGAYSGEHGDGLVRSEWIEPFFGPRLTACLAEVKSWLDPRGLMNPGKIVNPPRMDERALFRFKPGYETRPAPAVLDWSEWGGFDKAVEMCNNNGHCRKFDAGTMCPSYRATLDETHLTRGRANTLRLALSGQLPLEDAEQALDLCVSCKGCKRECPTGVDMARMKIEFLAHHKARRGYSWRDRAIAYLPRYAPWAARVAPASNKLAEAFKAALGFSARRALPQWRSDYFVDRTRPARGAGREVLVFVDSFNRWFEPHNARAAMRVLRAAGYNATAAQPLLKGRPLCCGRTFLAAGMVEQAKLEARRTLDALGPYAERGVPIIGLEPSCLFSFRDEYGVLMQDGEKLAKSTFLLEEFLAREPGALRFKELGKEVLLHGHCHQKAFDAMPALEKVLAMVPGLKFSTVQTSCCGMAGSFGYEAEHYDVSMKMAELSLLPAVRNAPESLVVAGGTSCRHQIADGAGREAWHVARLLEAALSVP